ncbi:MAG: peptidoglycan-binding protein, partial [Myxococcota bacterium]|nr:peptidoglycan-binding protein [Myxococcota bacterium]
LDMANVYFESDRLQSASLISRRVQVLDTAIKGGNPLSIAEALLGVSEAVELAGSSSGDESGTEEERKAAIEQKYADRMERLNKIGAAVSAIEQKDYLAFADSALAFTQLMSANRADANGNPTVVDKLKNVTGFALNGRKALKSDPPRYGDFLTSVFNIANEYKAAEFFEDAAKVSVKAQALQDAVNSGDTAAIMTALMGVAQVLEETQIISEVADGIKGFVGRVLGKKRAFEAGSEKHELWAIDLGDGKDPEMRVASGSGISPTRHVRDRQSRVNPSVQDAYFGPVVPNVKAAETRGEQKARTLKEAEQNNSDVRAAEKALDAEQQSLEAAMVELFQFAPDHFPVLGGGVTDHPTVRLLKLSLNELTDSQFDPSSTVFDAECASAVSNYQRNVGLAVDGLVGPQTWQKLQQGVREKQIIEETREELGRVESMEDLSRGVGNLVDGLLPEGVTRKFKIGVNVPVAGNPNVTFGMALNLEGSRINGDVKLKGQVDAKFSANVDVFIANLFLSVKGFGYLEVKGDHGKECIDYLLYFMQLKLRSVSTDLEEYVFSPTFEEAVLTQMNSDEDNNDYIEAGIGVEGAAGVEVDGNRGEV